MSKAEKETEGGTASEVDARVSWQDCTHRFIKYFGPVLKCTRCGASTILSADKKESKPIYAPIDEAS